MSDIVKIYIVRYCLKSGILVKYIFAADINELGTARVYFNPGDTRFFGKKEYDLDLKKAIAKAEELRVKFLVENSKMVDKIVKLNFSEINNVKD